MLTVLLLLVVLTAVLIVLCEYGVRLYVRRWSRPFLHLPGSRQVVHLHPKFARLLARRTVRYNVNELGERSDAVPRGKDVYRVLVLGGSAAECGALDQDETWAARLQSTLSSPEWLARLGKSRVHVGLIARSQLDTRGLELFVDALLPHYQDLDLLVVMNGTSDVLRWLDSGAPSGGIPEAYTEAQYLARCRSVRYTWRRPALLHFVVKGILTRLRVEERPNFGKMLVSEAEVRSAAGRTPLEHDPSAVFTNFELTFSRVLRKLLAITPNVIVVRQPWLDCAGLTEEDEQHLWSGRIGKPYSVPALFVPNSDLMRLCERIDALTVKVCRDNGITPVEVNNRVRGALGTHFYDHFHFTPEGASAVASGIIAALEQKDEAPCIAGVRT